jgi:hypothetical protein
VGDVRLEYNARKWFCEYVSSVLNSWGVLDDKGVGFYMRANEVVANLNVFGFAVI